MTEHLIPQLFSLLEQFGVKHLVCSPGSRNAAILNMADKIESLSKYVVVDERCAAFTALGISLVSKSPVALVCTSGSALLNYAPAISEAYYQGIPLIVISADRPLEWIDQDDSQTIRQPGALTNIVKTTIDLDACNNGDDYLWYANRLINEALINSTTGKQGPVHINVRLNGKVDGKLSPSSQPARKIDVLTPVSKLAPEVLNEYASFLSDKKIMLVAGYMQPDDRIQKAVSSFSQLPNVCMMAETVSNLHLSLDSYMVDSVLFGLDPKEEKDLAPDVVISLGGALISRKLKEFLRRNTPEFHLAFNLSPNIVDCFRSLSVKIECDPASFLKYLAGKIRKFSGSGGLEELKDSFSMKWFAKRADSMVKKIPSAWCDLSSLNTFFRSVPKETNVFLSNGTVVRYAQILSYVPSHATFANRGVSGIEGSTSTALGGALVYDSFTCLVTGDMSFGYDLAGLATGLEPASLRVVVLDNGGGDIFRFIPATRNLSIREDYLCADRNVPVAMLADSFGWIYLHADSKKTLKECLMEFWKPSMRPVILHIVTRKAENAKLLQDYLNS